MLLSSSFKFPLYSHIDNIDATVRAPAKAAPLKKLKNGALPIKPMAEYREADKADSTVSITVVGASGDLAKKKIYPALFALYYENCLPKVCFTPFSMLTFFLLRNYAILN